MKLVPMAILQMDTRGTMSSAFSMNKQHLNISPLTKLEFPDSVNQLTDPAPMHHVEVNRRLSPDGLKSKMD